MKRLLAALLLALCACSTPGTEALRPASDGALLEVALSLPCPGEPVELMRGPIQDWGYTTWDDEREVFRVVVREDLSYPFAVDVLVHEWAHVLVWDACQESDHGALWGVAYARCYRIAIAP